MKRLLPILLIICTLTAFCFFSGEAFSASTMIGDIDGDKKVTFSDAQKVFDYVAGKGILSLSELELSDVNSDGIVTIADAVQIFHFVSGILSELPYSGNGNGRLVIKQLPTCIQYQEGDAFKTDGLEVAVEYPNGKSERIYDFSVSGYNSTAGVKIIIVSYNGAKAAFTVTVLPKKMNKLTITALPKKCTYKQGEPLDLTGLKVLITYSDGFSAPVDDFVIYGFNGDIGEQTITIFYQTLTVTFKVKVTQN
ncbi:MAG: bacterial Ig-like domain-containing protein [Clostridia bacterium]